MVIDTKENLDDTENVCKHNNVIYLNRENGNSYEDAIRIGIKYASGKYILMMDADGSHEPKSIINLYNEIKNSDSDVVIGSRYCSGGKTDNNIILKGISKKPHFKLI